MRPCGSSAHDGLASPQADRRAPASEAFDAREAWRGWSDVEPHVHDAFYRFDALDEARAIEPLEAVKDLVAAFGRVWDDRVKRRRDAVEWIQSP
jgi:hypothetical protein